MLNDFINGSFEIVGSIANLLNVVQLYKDKMVRGVRVFPVVFFSAWGLWNLYYYPSLDQWMSFVGGLFIVLVNLIWIGLALKYRKN